MKTARSTNRRKFLLAAGLGGAGVAAGAVANGRKGLASAQSQPGAAEPTGYHESEHIRKYYKTAKV